MEVLLLGIYATIVWLLVRFRIIPWTTPVKVTVVIIPVVALTATGSYDAASTTLHATRIAVHLAAN